MKDLDTSVLMRIRMVGRRTADELVRNRMALRAAVDGSGVVDWQAYCASTGIPLVPAQPPADGCELLAGLPWFFEALAEELDDNVLAAILLSRICRPPGSQKTLEEIGAAASPALTRERVRQKERKLLGQITGGLLNDSYDGLGIHFHPGFARWWQRAADVLAEVEEIEVGSFVKLLATAWGVPFAAVVEQLPALVAVATGEPQMAAGFRAFATLDSRLLAEGSRGLDRLPVLKLRIGNAAVRLTEAGLPLVGDVIDSLRSGDLERVGMTAAKRVTDHLNLVASCIKETGVDWDGYRTTMSLDCLPPTPLVTPADFVSTLPEVIEKLLRSHSVSMRAGDIFRNRTGKDARNRMTLHQASEALSTFTSTIKREETVLLAWLNDVLVSREFWRLDVWLDGTWLAWWAEALETYEQSEDDYDRFADNLAWRWRLSGREMKSAVPTLWAVFTGYPDKRRPVHQPTVPVADAGSAMGRIRLHGFRRVH
ncbi:hypothetical protein [Bosea sp. LjRoot237]|uniref:hypothetical protein n=1 Tax=Bosea sp. LjRoot237 TaxID=3342292 RepID=UPI003ECD1613